jgi:hypothetical protein
MKKITLAILMLLGTFSIASAELGISVGVSGSIGLYETSGSEKEGAETNTAKAEELLVPMGSVFIEKSLGFLPGPLGRLSIGYDEVLHDLKTGTQSRTDDALGALPQSLGGARTLETNSVSATLSGINTIYATFAVTDWLYLKYGETNMDVQTTESLDSGATYGNFAVDGTVMGFGLQFESALGTFTRFEYNDTSYDGATIASSNASNSVTVKDIEGSSGKISIGKTF